jgi:hypothetical protein
MSFDIRIKTPFILLDYAISDYDIETHCTWKLKEFHVTTHMLDRMLKILGFTRTYIGGKQLSYKGVPIIEDNGLETSYALTQANRRIEL